MGGKGYAAPGGEFTRALFEWSLTPNGQFLLELLHGQRVVELGAGIMPYGYSMAAHARAKNFVAVEPFYADRQEIAQKACVEKELSEAQRIPRKVVSSDMLEYLSGEADDLLCIVACGIEDCILPGLDYRLKVEGEIERTLHRNCFFISSHTDLRPSGLVEREFVFPRPAHPTLMDRLRIHGKKDAYELWGDVLPEDRGLGLVGG